MGSLHESVVIRMEVYGSTACENGSKLLAVRETTTPEQLHAVMNVFGLPEKCFAFRTRCGVYLKSKWAALMLLSLSGTPKTSAEELVPGKDYIVVHPRGIYGLSTGDASMRVPPGTRLRYQKPAPIGHYRFLCMDIRIDGFRYVDLRPGEVPCLAKIGE